MKNYNTAILTLIVVFSIFVIYKINYSVQAFSEDKGIILTPGIYFEGEIPKSAPKIGKVLCVNEKNLVSRLTDGKLCLSKEKHPLVDEQGDRVNIIGCNTKETPVFYIDNKLNKFK